MSAADRLGWDATTVLEALGAADVALWVWEPERDRLRLNGATRALGLGPLAPSAPPPPCAPWCCRRTAPRPRTSCACASPGSEVRRACGCAAPRPASGAASGWRRPARRRRRRPGNPLRRLREGRAHRPAGPPQLRPPGPRAAARPAAYELVVADLNRLRRLNEALGHERADLVLAALGSRLAAAFPRDALMARIGEDEFAVLVRRGRPTPPRPCARRWSSRCGWPASTSIPTLSIGAVLGRRRRRRAGGRRTAAPRRAGGRGRPRPPAAAAGRRLWPGAGERRPVAAGAGGRPARRDRARRDLRLLPADRAALHRRALRLRGPGPLAPSPPRLPGARRLPRPMRRDGPDGGAGRAHDARVGPPAGRLARAPTRRPAT